MNKDLEFGMFAHRYYGKRYTVEVRRQMLVSSLASQVVGEVSVRWVGWNGQARTDNQRRVLSQFDVGTGKPEPVELAPRRYIITYKSMSKDESEQFERKVAWELEDERAKAQVDELAKLEERPIKRIPINFGRQREIGTGPELETGAAIPSVQQRMAYPSHRPAAMSSTPDCLNIEMVRQRYIAQHDRLLDETIKEALAIDDNPVWQSLLGTTTTTAAVTLTVTTKTPRIPNQVAQSIADFISFEADHEDTRDPAFTNMLWLFMLMLAEGQAVS
jgi:hypothetical protein